MTIELGWWLAPALVTLATFIAANHMCSDSSGGGGFMDMSSFFDMVTYMIFFVIPSLVAWLIWALIK